MASTTVFDLPSEAAGRTYRVFIHTPDGEPPPGGWPVILVTDGNYLFPIAAAVAPLFILSGPARTMVVGVGYPTDDVAALMTLRLRDLTPETPLSGLRQLPGQPPPKLEDYGGAASFNRFLAGELRRTIVAGHAASESDWTLYGHSLGGLFVLGVLFEAPESYRSFVASSPSIWWNRCAVLAGEDGFAKRIARGGVAPNLLLTVGGLEDELPKTSPSADIPLDDLVAQVSEARMVHNARELAGRLAAAYEGSSARFSFQVFEGEGHMSVIPASVSRAFAHVSP